MPAARGDIRCFRSETAWYCERQVRRRGRKCSWVLLHSVTGTIASIAVGCAQRKQRAIWPPTFDAARERWPLQQPRAVSVHVEKLLADRVRPVGIEQQIGRASCRER